MNILLLDGLPEEYEGIPISADFRNMIQVDLILNDPDINDIEKTIASLYQLYPEIPQDIPKAIKGLEWFYSRGKDLSTEEADLQNKNAPNQKKAFDFNQDANYIYAAFYATYNISLTTIDFLHWWEFMALFEGLPETTLIQRIIYWRTADVSKMDKQERSYVLKMRKQFELVEPNSKKLTLEELNQQTKDRVARRFAEAEAAVRQELKQEKPPI
ncbi:MAG: hypothetical protein GX222_08900 [Ruminococcaceae bacterium]|jgi:hypothetical protein|nr:hypothetical protein [Oscillospiraceae bacterium]